MSTMSTPGACPQKFEGTNKDLQTRSPEPPRAPSDQLSRRPAPAGSSTHERQHEATTMYMNEIDAVRSMSASAPRRTASNSSVPAQTLTTHDARPSPLIIAPPMTLRKSHVAKNDDHPKHPTRHPPRKTASRRPGVERFRADHLQLRRPAVQNSARSEQRRQAEVSRREPSSKFFLNCRARRSRPGEAAGEKPRIATRTRAVASRSDLTSEHRERGVVSPTMNPSTRDVCAR